MPCSTLKNLLFLKVEFIDQDDYLSDLYAPDARSGLLCSSFPKYVDTSLERVCGGHRISRSLHTIGIGELADTVSFGLGPLYVACT